MTPRGYYLREALKETLCVLFFCFWVISIFVGVFYVGLEGTAQMRCQNGATEYCAPPPNPKG
jgi:hypothetical protein